MAKAKIRIGLDFDGVVAYNPFRVIRAPVTWFKRKFRHQRTVNFFVPHTRLQKLLWLIMHESSVFPAKGVRLLRELAGDPRYEFYLITARYSFLRDNLEIWLKRNQLTNVFKSIHSNMADEQPHIYKQRMVNELRLDVFVEDNLDIVQHLTRHTKVPVGWIYNFFDKNVEYPHKFPYLERALNWITEQKS